MALKTVQNITCIVRAEEDISDLNSILRLTGHDLKIFDDDMPIPDFLEFICERLAHAWIHVFKVLT